MYVTVYNGAKVGGHRDRPFQALAVPTRRTMQFEHVPETARFSPTLTTATTQTVELALQPNGETLNAGLQQAIKAVCLEARRQGLRAEELIILLKKTWHSHPELHTRSSKETTRLFESVVTMCVEEFYRGGP